jgi:hypothetical protein
MVRVSKTVPYDIEKGKSPRLGEGRQVWGFLHSFMAESAVDVCNIL